jgi:hypothetical protein
MSMCVTVYVYVSPKSIELKHKIGRLGKKTAG